MYSVVWRVEPAVKPRAALTPMRPLLMAVGESVSAQVVVTPAANQYLPLVCHPVRRTPCTCISGTAPQHRGAHHRTGDVGGRQHGVRIDVGDAIPSLHGDGRFVIVYVGPSADRWRLALNWLADTSVRPIGPSPGEPGRSPTRSLEPAHRRPTGSAPAARRRTATPELPSKPAPG